MVQIGWLNNAILALLATSQIAAAATAQVGSREYKVLLKPELFKTSPGDASNSFLTNLKSSLQTNGFDRTIDGSFSADNDRTVFFFDTKGSCALRSAGYSMRERDDGSKRKIELKFGSSDQTTSANRDVSGNSSKAETKFEDDITPPSKETFSHSTSEPLPDSKNINKAKDIKDLFPTTTQFDSIKDQALVKVSGLTIHELTFDGPTSDLGQETAEFTITVWYANGASSPSLAEVSFGVPTNSDGVFTTKVTQRSQLIFNTIQNMTNWVLSPSTTKTAWVYAYQSGFCS